MAVFSSIATIFSAVGSAVGSAGAGLSAAAGLIGTGLQAYGANKAAKAQAKAEDLRQKQLALETDRQRRSVVRQAQIARATAQSNATAQGAQGGSGLAGGLGQVSNQANQNMQGINQGASIGMQMFGLNKQMAKGNQIASYGSAFQGFSNFLASTFETRQRQQQLALG